MSEHERKVRIPLSVRRASYALDDRRMGEGSIFDRLAFDDMVYEETGRAPYRNSPYLKQTLEGKSYRWTLEWMDLLGKARDLTGLPIPEELVPEGFKRK